MTGCADAGEVGIAGAGLAEVAGIASAGAKGGSTCPSQPA